MIAGYMTLKPCHFTDLDECLAISLFTLSERLDNPIICATHGQTNSKRMMLLPSAKLVNRMVQTVMAFLEVKIEHVVELNGFICNRCVILQFVKFQCKPTLLILKHCTFYSFECFSC